MKIDSRPAIPSLRGLPILDRGPTRSAGRTTCVVQRGVSRGNFRFTDAIAAGRPADDRHYNPRQAKEKQWPQLAQLVWSSYLAGLVSRDNQLVRIRIGRSDCKAALEMSKRPSRVTAMPHAALMDDGSADTWVTTLSRRAGLPPGLQARLLQYALSTAFVHNDTVCAT
jgi:hypothetical protein